MFKTYLLGVVLGVTAAIAVAFFVPVVDQAREDSAIGVAQNGVNLESFHINIPVDRVAVGADNTSLPDNLEWPAELGSTRAEIYKLRNVRDQVIGIASRVTVQDPVYGEAIEWVLHFPARGSVYAAMEPALGEDGIRQGDWKTGTGEFDARTGRLTERYVADESGDQLSRGRIELESFFKRRGGES